MNNTAQTEYLQQQLQWQAIDIDHLDRTLNTLRKQYDERLLDTNEIMNAYKDQNALMNQQSAYDDKVEASRKAKLRWVNFVIDIEPNEAKNGMAQLAWRNAQIYQEKSAALEAENRKQAKQIQDLGQSAPEVAIRFNLMEKQIADYEA